MALLTGRIVTFSMTGAGRPSRGGMRVARMALGTGNLRASSVQRGAMTTLAASLCLLEGVGPRQAQDIFSMLRLFFPTRLMGIAGVALGAGDLGIAPLEILAMTELATRFVPLERFHDEFSMADVILPLHIEMRVAGMAGLAVFFRNTPGVIGAMAELAGSGVLFLGYRINGDRLAMPRKALPINYGDLGRGVRKVGGMAILARGKTRGCLVQGRSVAGLARID